MVEKKVLCRVCGLEAVKDRTKCINHLQYEAAASYIRYHQLKRRGICPKCGVNKPEKGRVTCEDCLKIFRISNKFSREKRKLKK